MEDHRGDMRTNRGRRSPRLPANRGHQLFACVAGVILLAGWDCGRAASVASAGPPPQITSFITQKEAQAHKKPGESVVDEFLAEKQREREAGK